MAAKIDKLAAESKEAFPRSMDVHWAEIGDIEKGIKDAAIDLGALLDKRYEPLRDRWQSRVASYVTEQRFRRNRLRCLRI